VALPTPPESQRERDAVRSAAEWTLAPHNIQSHLWLSTCDLPADQVAALEQCWKRAHD
jgi:hypothetical protein